MNDNDMGTSPTAGDAGSDDVTRAWMEAPDPLVSDLVTQASLWNFGITVLLPGMILEGTLMPFDQWGQQNLEKIKPAVSDATARFIPPSGEGFDEVEARLLKIAGHYLDVSKEDVASDEAPPRFLHLRDVTIRPVGAGMSQEMPLMRVPIAHIIGWAYGTSKSAS